MHITCPPESYDPNIEPAKDDVLFEDEALVLAATKALFKSIYGELKDVMGNTSSSRTGTRTPATKKGFEVLLARAKPPVSSEDTAILDDQTISMTEPSLEGPKTFGLDAQLVDDILHDAPGNPTIPDQFHCQDQRCPSISTMGDQENDGGSVSLSAVAAGTAQHQSERSVFSWSMYGFDEDEADAVSTAADSAPDVGDNEPAIGLRKDLSMNPWTIAAMNAPERPLQQRRAPSGLQNPPTSPNSQLLTPRTNPSCAAHEQYVEAERRPVIHPAPMTTQAPGSPVESHLLTPTSVARDWAPANKNLLDHQSKARNIYGAGSLDPWLKGIRGGPTRGPNTVISGGDSVTDDLEREFVSLAHRVVTNPPERRNPVPQERRGHFDSFPPPEPLPKRTRTQKPFVSPLIDNQYSFETAGRHLRSGNHRQSQQPLRSHDTGQKGLLVESAESDAVNIDSYEGQTAESAIQSLREGSLVASDCAHHRSITPRILTTSRNGPSNGPDALEEDDPRAILARSKLAEAVGGRSRLRRTRTALLPLETVPEELQTQYIIHNIDISISTIESSLAEISPLEYHLEPGLALANNALKALALLVEDEWEKDGKTFELSTVTGVRHVPDRDEDEIHAVEIY